MSIALSSLKLTGLLPTGDEVGDPSHESACELYGEGNKMNRRQVACMMLLLRINTIFRILSLHRLYLLPRSFGGLLRLFARSHFLSSLNPIVMATSVHIIYPTLSRSTCAWKSRNTCGVVPRTFQSFGSATRTPSMPP